MNAPLPKQPGRQVGTPGYTQARIAASPQRNGKRFRNLHPAPPTVSLETRHTLWDFFFNKPKNTRPAGAIPVDTLTPGDLISAPDHSLWRLGHSTILLKLGGEFFITDPVFCQRASPVQFAGPKRFHAPPIALKDLPPIRAVILSHDHYDHLDAAAMRALRGKAATFVIPLGVGAHLRRWGVPAQKIQEYDWWESVELGDVTLTCTPAQHFSGRSLTDGNRTLWCSWVIEHSGVRVYFSGDGGYWEGFAQIGERLGPFDLALMEDGAYDAAWPYVHMSPAQSVQAHRDLNAKVMLPIHNATFDLAMHAWNDPFEQIAREAERAGVTLTTPRIGQRVGIAAPPALDAWWRGVDAPAPALTPAASAAG